jgi:hypothetical protein
VASHTYKDEPSGDEFQFHYPDDFGGDILVTIPSPRLKEDTPSTTVTVRIPAAALIDLVTGHFRSRVVEDIYSMDNKEFIGWLLSTERHTTADSNGGLTQRSAHVQLNKPTTTRSKTPMKRKRSPTS